MNHKRVTIDFMQSGGGSYDIAISQKMTVKQLLQSLAASLHTSIDLNSVIKLPLKQKTMMPEDRFMDYSISNGELLVVYSEQDKKGES
ncbi:EsaB/YukD family protein [Rummeliibacillus sp. BSL5]